MTTDPKVTEFLANHEKMHDDLASALLTIEDQRKEIANQDSRIALQNDEIAQLRTDKNVYLQYAFELSAQLQFIVAGSARALLIASHVRTAISMKSANIPDVPGADIAELEGILKRIGDGNDAANGKPGTNNGQAASVAPPTAPALPGSNPGPIGQPSTVTQMMPPPQI